MNRTGKLTKILSIVLCVAMVMLALVSCGKKSAAFTLTADGKDYVLTESEYEFLLMYRKYQIFYVNGLKSTFNNSFSTYFDDEQLTDGVKDSANTIVAEKYLMDKFNLSIDEKEISELEKTYDTAIKNIGGKGVFKRQYGWTWDQMFEYDLAIKRQTLIKDYLYNEETGIEKVTDEELEKYYTENFKQYQIIMIDTKNDIAKDDDGNKIYLAYDKDNNSVEITDISEEYLKEKEYTLAYSYKTEKIEDEDRTAEKAALADVILAELKNGTDFQELALKYSDLFLTEYFKNGYIIEGDLINDEDAIKAINALEVGDYTEEAISIESGSNMYIIKRVELKEKAYEDAYENATDTEYADLFEDYKDTVADYKYEQFLEKYVNAVVEEKDVTGKYSMASVALSPLIS